MIDCDQTIDELARRVAAAAHALARHGASAVGVAAPMETSTAARTSYDVRSNPTDAHAESHGFEHDVRSPFVHFTARAVFTQENAGFDLDFSLDMTYRLLVR